MVLNVLGFLFLGSKFWVSKFFVKNYTLIQDASFNSIYATADQKPSNYS